MWWLPFRHLSLDFRVSQEEALARLQNVTRPINRDFRQMFARETSTFVGEVGKDRLYFRRPIRGRNSFVPYVIGRLVQGPTGARIEGVMRPHTFTLVFLGVWMLLLAAPAALGVRELLQSGARSHPAALIAIAVWGLMYPLGVLSFGIQARRMNRTLQDLLGRSPNPVK